MNLVTFLKTRGHLPGQKSFSHFPLRDMFIFVLTPLQPYSITSRFNIFYKELIMPTLKAKRISRFDTTVWVLDFSVCPIRSGQLGLAVSVWVVSVWVISVTGHFGLGTFWSRHFCTWMTDCICLFKWLNRQTKCHASWCYTNSLWCCSQVTKQS